MHWSCPRYLCNRSSHTASGKGDRNVFPKGEWVILVKYCYIGMQVSAHFLKTHVITAVEELIMYLFGGNKSCQGLAHAGIYMKWVIAASLYVLKPVNLIQFFFPFSVPTSCALLFLCFSLTRSWVLPPSRSWEIWLNPCFSLTNVCNPVA